jgi:hypothetical protein
MGFFHLAFPLRSPQFVNLTRREVTRRRTHFAAAASFDTRSKRSAAQDDETEWAGQNLIVSPRP